MNKTNKDAREWQENGQGKRGAYPALLGLKTPLLGERNGSE